MPLLRLEPINDKSWIGLWQIQENENWFRNRIKSDLENLDVLDGIKNMNKRLEWLATRLLLPLLAEKLGCGYSGTIKNEFGKPYLRDNSCKISISHSYPYVATSIHSETEIGIDIETIKSDKILRISKKFMNERELAFSGSDSTLSTLIWSAKESLYKLHGRKFVIFKEDLEIEAFELSKSGSFKGIIKLNNEKQEFTINYESNESFQLTYTVC